jgi:UDP-N-acetyl-D-glucosamine dehydrogenase
MKKALLKNIRTHTARIGVIGLGYVGLPLVIRFAEKSFRVTGFDIDKEKVDKLNSRKSYIYHIPHKKIKALVNTGKFKATTDYSLIRNMDAILICVPTPLKDKKEPDMKYVEATSQEIKRNLRKGQLIILESTTYPGTTREILLPLIQSCGFTPGEDIFLAYSPEREDPGNPHFTTKNIPKVIGGLTPHCTEAASALYQCIIDKVVPVSSPEVAEFSKLLENIFRSVNIALVNELKILADRMDLDIWEVIDAASTKPFGFMRFTPGPGLGGHCIPIDPYYLSWKARELDFNAHFIELAGEVNTSMPEYVVSRLSDALNQKEKCLRGSKVLILGLAYKKDTDDVRESPALEIISILKNKQAEVYYNDPHVLRTHKMRKYDFDIKSSDLTEDFLKQMDVVVIVTDHSSYDYEWIVQHAKLVLDTRNATEQVKSDRHKIIKA